MACSNTDLPLLFPDDLKQLLPGLRLRPWDRCTRRSRWMKASCIRVEDYARGPTAGSSSQSGTRRPAACCRWTPSKRCWASPDSVVVVDEAYVDFGGESAIARSIATRTCWSPRRWSASLAGLRVGFLAVGRSGRGAERINSFNSYPLPPGDRRGAAAAFETTPISVDPVIDSRDMLRLFAGAGLRGATVGRQSVRPSSAA